MAHIDLDSLRLSDTMRGALQECIDDPDGRVEVAWRTAQALEKRGLVERSGNWIWVTPEQAAQYAPPVEDEGSDEADAEDDDGEYDDDTLDPPEPVAADEEPEVVPEPESNPFAPPEIRCICPRVKGVPRQEDGTITAWVGLVTTQGVIVGWDADSVKTERGSFDLGAVLAGTDQRLLAPEVAPEVAPEPEPEPEPAAVSVRPKRRRRRRR